MKFHSSSIEEILQAVNSTENGLSAAEAENRLDRDGYNELAAKEKDPIWKLFLENFKDPMVIVLLIAAIVQIILGEIMESIIIFAVLMINAIISVIQTKKAESSLDALRQLS
ncbi:cation-transporting P-type ATPase, partial [Pradoshia sp.]